MILLCALAMSVGWGFRGNYGHEAGAMVPGALLGLAISLTSRRPDWQARGVTLAFLGAIGWAFGGQMSYDKVIGYTLDTEMNNVQYGYWCLFLIGGLWGGLGAGILALGLTETSETLDRWCPPVILLWLVWQASDFTGLTGWLERNAWLHEKALWLQDTHWVAALTAVVAAGLSWFAFRNSRAQAVCIVWLASGWLIGLFVLTGICRLHLTPPRSDNWAGCVGLFVAYCGSLLWQRNRVALYFLAWGFFAGGVGFAIAELPHVLGSGYWGELGQWVLRYHLDTAKWMDQGFGLIMGAIVAIGAWRIQRGGLTTPAEFPSKNFDLLALVYLLVVVTWENLYKNVKHWNQAKLLPPRILDLEYHWWFIIIAALLALVVIVALVRQNQGRIQLTPPGIMGRSRWLFLLLLWIALAGEFSNALPDLKDQGSFFAQSILWLTAGICSLIVVALPEGFDLVEEPRPASDPYWKTRWVVLVGLILAPGIVYGLARCSIESHQQLIEGSRVRFGTPEEVNKN
jgi:hypothetical protein